MSQQPLRVLVVEDDYFIAENLASEIRACGDEVIGPFADIRQAIEGAGGAQAAILDVKIRDGQSFPVADSLSSCQVPFVFLTGYDSSSFPDRFTARHVYYKPSHARPLLRDLHAQHAEIARSRDDSMDGIVRRMLLRARCIMPDKPSAERLVEAALLRAIAHPEAGSSGPELAAWLSLLLEEEYRQRGRLHLN